MSRSLTQQVIDELENKSMFPVFMMRFSDGNNWFNYTTADVPIMMEINDSTSEILFTPRGFAFESIRYSTGQIVNDATIRMDNLDQIMTAIFGGSSLQEQPASLYCAVLNPNGQVIGNVLFFEGEINNYDLDETEVLLTISSIFTNWSHKSHGKHSASCRWKRFKGPRCKYSGDATWCDRSYTRCVELENSDNFGGFRFLPDLENKTLYWGPTPQERND